MIIHDAELKEARNKLQCDNCEKTFHTPRNSMNHQNNAKCSEQRPHKCDICINFFRRKGGLSLHNRQVHFAKIEDYKHN